MNTETINKILNVTESYQAPQIMLDIMLNPIERESILDEFLKNEQDLSYEWFQMYFENEHADRKVKKQDFTPNSVSKLGAKIIGESDRYFEATAGTGGMMIQYWNLHPHAYFELEELSDRAIPFLLFNMSIRNMNGTVRHGDSLAGEFKAVYIVEKGKKYSFINEMSEGNDKT